MRLPRPSKASSYPIQVIDHVELLILRVRTIVTGSDRQQQDVLTGLLLECH